MKSLSFDPRTIPASIYRLGLFVVTWSFKGGGSLVVTHVHRPGRIVWASVPGVAFVEGARGVANARESRGHIKVRDQLVVRCAQQTITAFDYRGTSLRVQGVLRGRSAEVGYTLTLAPCGPDELGFALTLADSLFNRTTLVYASDPDECFYGFGVQYSRVNMKGRRLPILVSEQGIGRGLQPLTALVELWAGAGGSWHSTYAGVPHYLTSRMRSLYLETYEYVVFDLRQRDRARIELFAPRMQGRIVAGDTPAALIAAYTARIGRMRPLPDWLMGGAVVGVQGGTERARTIWARLREAGVPLAGLWLQDWVGRRQTSFGAQLWWNWELDTELYANWDVLRTEVESAGARLLVYVNPLLVDVDERPGHRRNLYREAAEQGLLVAMADGQAYALLQTDFRAGLVDLTNPKGRAFLQEAIGAALDVTGATGWMADYGEGLPLDARLNGGRRGWSFHNRYPEAWARLNEALAAEREEREPVFFMRSGYRESPRHARLFWLGDQLISWDAHDGLKTAVTGLLSGGFSGFSLSHSDAGGYTTLDRWPLRYRRTRELLLRWVELCCFTTVLRTHEGSRPLANHQVYSDAATLRHFAWCAKLYAAWGFYRRRLLEEAATTGLPVVRHPFLHFPDDPAMQRVTWELFLVGSELLVAPALDQGVRSVRVPLPRGKWVHLWSGAMHISPGGGKAVSVPAPLGRPAVLFRYGSTVGGQFRDALRRLGLMEPVSRETPSGL